MGKSHIWDEAGSRESYVLAKAGQAQRVPVQCADAPKVSNASDAFSEIVHTLEVSWQRMAVFCTDQVVECDKIVRVRGRETGTFSTPAEGEHGDHCVWNI